jgi:predicted NAD/FAD-dependent oxidoreductase
MAEAHAARGLRVAVVGAGLAGLSAARALTDAGAEVTVIEKSRAPGGRAATRRDGDYRFDHGAQYFTQRDARTRARLDAWVRDGVVAPWTGTIAVRDGGAWRTSDDGPTRWVAVPGMRALGESLARDLDVRYATTVASLGREASGWALRTTDGSTLGGFDRVLVTAPAPQASALLAPHAPAFGEPLAAATMHPCVAAMVVLSRRPHVSWDAAFVNDSPLLSWVARNASKPGRNAHECWVLHATPSWSAAHLARDASSLVPALLDAFREVLGDDVPVVHAVGHRWRYAIPAAPASAAEALYDAAQGLGAAGDWCVGGRIEGALLSGDALARHVLED